MSSSGGVAIYMDNTGSGSYYFGMADDLQCNAANSGSSLIPDAGDELYLPVPTGASKMNLFVYDGSQLTDNVVWKGYLDKDGSYIFNDGNMYEGSATCINDSCSYNYGSLVPQCVSGGGSAGGGGSGTSGAGGISSTMWLFIVLFLLAAVAVGGMWYRKVKSN